MNLEKKTEKKLAPFFPKGLDLTWHENKTSFLSARKIRGKVALRLHRLFTKASPTVIEALSQYVLKGDKKAAVVVRKMANDHFSNVQIAPLELTSCGTFYDLKKMYQLVKRRYFSPSMNVEIGWGKKVQRGGARSITLGSYDRHRNQIQINPLLDHKDVPSYFIEFVVYHEMLHAVITPKMNQRGWICSHTPEFRRKEKEFEQYELAKVWEKKVLPTLRKKTFRFYGWT